MASNEVLVVGAGPTGLVLALWLTRLGIRVRVIDKVGNGVAGVTVNWKPLDSLSLLPDNTVTQTDANGVASPGRWIILPGLLAPSGIQATPSLPNIENSPLTLWAKL